MDGWMDGWMNGWMDGWIDGWWWMVMDECWWMVMDGDGWMEITPDRRTNANGQHWMNAIVYTFLTFHNWNNLIECWCSSIQFPDNSFIHSIPTITTGSKRTLMA
jgi:hypothetical protein